MSRRMRVFTALLLIAPLLIASQALARPGAGPLDLSRDSQETQSGAPGEQSPFHAIPPLPYALSAPLQSLPPPLRSEAQDDPTPNPTGTIQRPGYDAQFAEDGRLILDGRFLTTGLSNDPRVGTRAFGVFDLTDLLSPQDPYLSDKLQLLHETFAQRVAMREAHSERVMDRALAELPRYLQEIWYQEGWDLATKRHLLFALWDECAEEGNELMIEGGHAARLQIEDFIAAVLPAGSANSFRSQELTAFNQTRTSLAKFAPSGY